ncbi:MAG: hypothetical protein ACXU8N_11655 [Telluria sp.]
MNHNSFDASIPVLTEVFTEPADAPADAHAPTPDLETRAIGGWGADEWELLERRLSERILHSLQQRTDFVLEQRVRDAMAEVLQHALKDLTTQVRAGLHETLEKIVTRAVQQEITHLQAQKK